MPGLRSAPTPWVDSGVSFSLSTRKELRDLLTKHTAGSLPGRDCPSKTCSHRARYPLRHSVYRPHDTPADLGSSESNLRNASSGTVISARVFHISIPHADKGVTPAPPRQALRREHVPKLVHRLGYGADLMQRNSIRTYVSVCSRGGLNLGVSFILLVGFYEAAGDVRS